MSGQDFNTCCICQGQIKSLFKVKGYEIYKCSNCGLGITEGLKIQKTDYHRDQVYLQEGAQFRNIFQRRVNFIEFLHLKTGKVLEIGSSTGLMLSLFKEKGWDVLGVEISKDAAQSAIEKGIPTLMCPVEEIKLPQQSLDVIIMNHTLEHLENPPVVIKKISSLLKVGGILLVDVPNFGGLSARIFRSRWFALLPSEHLWHFTYDSLFHLLNNNGLEIVKRSSPSGIWDYGNPLKEIWMSFVGLKKRFFMNVLTLIPNFVVTSLNQGSTLTILAQKVKK